MRSKNNEYDWLAERFEANRTRLRAVAYRMLGGLDEAEDAVQEAWLRLSRSNTSSVENLEGWLTTIVARVCLNMLHARKSRREEPLDVHTSELIVSQQEKIDPEQEALLADSVGLALLVILDTLSPAERLAFVLHDLFAMPFDEIARVVERTPAAARQLASRARRRVQGAAIAADVDLTRQREVVNAFLAASREGSFDALLAVLDPNVVIRVDRGATLAGASMEIRGASAVAKQTISGGFSRLAHQARPVLVNGSVGAVVASHGRLLLLLGLVITGSKITEINVISDPARLSQLRLSLPDPS